MVADVAQRTSDRSLLRVRGRTSVDDVASRAAIGKSKIAYLVSLYPAPSHTFIRREIDALRRRGIDVDTFSVRRPPDSELLSESDRSIAASTFYILPASPFCIALEHVAAFARKPGRYLATFAEALRHRVPGVKAFVWALFYFVEAILLARELERRGVAHLHNHFANAGANVGYLATHYTRIPWSLTLHGISEFDYPAGPLLAAKIEHASFVACASHFVRAQGKRAVHARHWPKLFIVRCGVELEVMPQQPARPRKRTRLVSVGRLAPEKCHLGLLDAFAEAVHQGLDLELRIVGSGPEREQIEQRIRDLGVEDRCALTGHLPEQRVLDEIAAADVFVISSLMEGLPVVLMECLALKVPAIAPCVAGIPELVADRETGLLFAPAHWDQLAARIVELCGDRELRVRCGIEGRRRVESEFDVNLAVAPLFERFRAA